MSRVDPARLDDLADVVGQVRTWEGVEDRGGGTFYVKRKPFLHFHAGRDSRRADVRRLDGWVEVDLPEPLPAGVKLKFLTLLREEFEGR